MTENDLIKRGFKLVSNYIDTKFNHKKYKKGFLTIDFIVNDEGLDVINLSIEEVYGMSFKLDELILLDHILNK